LSNPFDDDNGTFSVLVNDLGQHCLWPQAVAVPAGWRAVRSAVSRADALAYVEVNWRDLRPAGPAARAGTGLGG
jgi:MbtH protein